MLAAVSDDERPMIARDPSMKDVIALADQVARSEASILITGESGVGKEVMARYVHANSRRRDRPFISVNCAAIPENLLESELFGHEKGAFTGALARRIGKFEEASGGTLLMDEISEMDVRLQAKLLRALQERKIDRVGGGKPVKVDIRVIATSNRDLAQAVRDGTFREDLLYRLNVGNLRLPALHMRHLFGLAELLRFKTEVLFKPLVGFELTGLLRLFRRLAEEAGALPVEFSLLLGYFVDPRAALERVQAGYLLLQCFRLLVERGGLPLNGVDFIYQLVSLFRLVVEQVAAKHQ